MMNGWRRAVLNWIQDDRGFLHAFAHFWSGFSSGEHVKIIPLIWGGLKGW